MLRRVFFPTLFVAALLLAAWIAVGDPWARRVEPQVRTSLTVSQLLGGPADSVFDRAVNPRPFNFPLDHGPHPDFRTEWWYLTGNLEGPEGRPFGFQFTLFRSALRPGDEPSDPRASRSVSSWRARQLYMGHLAITDGSGGSFFAFERFARGAGGLAGATAEPFRVWLEDWELAGASDESGDIFPLRLKGEEEGVGLALSMVPAKPLVLQGDSGLSQKGPEAGNASFYYSFTRLEAQGRIVLGGDTFQVSGLAWMDREWSTSALSPGQVGWDWFALQLEDGSDLMYYQLRRRDGTSDPLSRGILVDGEGKGVLLRSTDVQLNVRDEWTSPLDGTVYPSGWQLSVPGQELILVIQPLLQGQELDLSFRYWEGAVRAIGTRGGKEIQGNGYVELTGYSDPPSRMGTDLQRR